MLGLSSTGFVVTGVTSGANVTKVPVVTGFSPKSASILGTPWGYPVGIETQYVVLPHMYNH